MKFIFKSIFKVVSTSFVVSHKLISNSNNHSSKFVSATALQTRTGHWLITANLWSLTAHIDHIMIIVNGGLSKKSLWLLFPKISFEQS